jgi:3-hydroxyacyl-CoA dehydrogenase/enoyl-CoA hydratase/3-hydroxybutyryl-CoA epimerase
MKTAFKLKVDKDGFARLIFDLPGEKVNKFSAHVMQELEEQLKALKKRDDIKIMSFESAKKDIFIAGADIKELEAITTRKDALAKSQKGQKLFNMLEELPFPTVAVINGACLGGGLECAMACTYRVVTDNPKAVMGCPEVQLGILPGWGGTQRMTHLTGLLAALPMLLTGKPAKGSKAVKIKLADALISAEFLEEKSKEFIRDCLTPTGRKWVLARRKRSGLLKLLMEDNPLGRAFVFHQAHKGLMQKTGGNYPATLEILKVLKETVGKPLMTGLEREAEAFADLAPTRVSKNLVKLFFTNTALTKDTGVEGDVEFPEIKSVAVLGAGVMGGGISWLFSSKGYPVRMKDINWDAVSKGFEEAKVYYKQMVKRRKITPTELRIKMDTISGTLDYAGFSGEDVVVEAIIENIDVKKKVLAELEQNVGKDTIICSNTSALSITEMGKALKHPERFIGMHFFNPVNRMPLVEVIPGEKTSDKTIAATIALVKKLGKTPVLVQNCAGFLVNRLLLPYMNEAVVMVQEGADITAIDRVIKKYGMPMGPLTLADEVGIDICWKVTGLLEAAYSPRMKMTELLALMHDQDHLLGKKGGKGFYIHKPRKKGPVNPAVQERVDEIVKWTEIKSAGITSGEIIDRCIFIMINEASRCIEEGIVKSAAYLDMALIMGTGFPPFRGGLLRYADELGIKDIVEKLKVMAEKYGERYSPSPLLLKMAENGQKFYETEV